MRTYQPNRAFARPLVLVSALLVLLHTAVLSQTVLTTGDIAFTGYNSDNPDDFSFVLLKDVQAGTTITFTDRGWKATGGFRAGEGTLTITFAHDRTTGEQFRVPGNTGIFIDQDGLSAGSSTGSNILLSAAGDQLFAYQGTEPLDNSPAEQAKILAAIQMNGPWDADATSDNTSYLPPGLTNGLNALAISPQIDNARFSCAVTGPNLADLRAALHDPTYWDKDDNIRFSLPAPCELTCGLSTDQKPPLVICPFIMEDFLSAACDFTLGDYRPSVFVMDNCDPLPTLVQSPLPGTTVYGNTMITITAQDKFSNISSCTFEFFLEDTIAPNILSYPGAQIGVVGSNCTFVLPDYSGMITFSDNCDPAPVVLQNPVPGTVVSQNTTITLTVQDESGNASHRAFQLTLLDLTEPSVYCLIDKFAFFNANCGFVIPDYRSEIVVSDECDPNPVITQSPLPGTVVYGNTTVSFKITDASGNQGSCAFNLWLTDGTPPALSCPPPFDVPFDTLCQAIMPDIRPAVTLSDNCDPNPVRLQFPAPGTPLTSDIPVVVLAVDASQNTNFCFTQARPRDLTPPSLTCKNATIALGASGTYTLTAADVVLSASDNCSSPVSLTFTPAMLNCSHDGQTIAVTVQATDAAGNSSVCTAMVAVSSSSSIASPWTSTQVGNNFGAATFNGCSTGFQISSIGFASPSAALDAIQFVHRPLCGSGQITARVVSINVNGASAGVMMRETLAPGSKKVALKSRLSNAIWREVRNITGSMANSQQFPSSHTWLRIIRNGNSFEMQTSPNGTNWIFVGSALIPMSNCIQVGVFAESTTNSTLATALLDNVSVTGVLTPLMANPSLDMALTEPETHDGLRIVAWPNPATDFVHLRLEGEAPEAPVVLALFNSLGQMVWADHWDAAAVNPVLHLAVQSLPPGIYTLQMRNSEGKTVSRKLAVQR